MTIQDGAVIPWQMFGFNVQPQIAREFGVRTDVPRNQRHDWQREIVLNGPEEKKHIAVTSSKGLHELDFTFRNARLTVIKELQRAEDEKRLARASRFFIERTCPECHGTRLSPTAAAPQIGQLGLADVTAKTLEDLIGWASDVPGTLPEAMRPMANQLVDTLLAMARRLLDLGLGYLGLDRAGATLSTGERQRVQLARAVRNETTGVLYVLDEPSIGLHPSNIRGLKGVIADLLDEGNSVVMVDHDPLVLRQAEHLIEIGPGSGREGGRVVATGTVAEVDAHPQSRISGYLTGREQVRVRSAASEAEMFSHGTIGDRKST